jgi:hypothetical protein
MADKEFWIQLENRPWDACPNNIDRMHGADIEHVLGKRGAPPITVTLTSPETGVSTNRTMFLPVNRGILKLFASRERTSQNAAERDIQS